MSCKKKPLVIYHAYFLSQFHIKDNAVILMKSYFERGNCLPIFIPPSRNGNCFSFFCNEILADCIYSGHARLKLKSCCALMQVFIINTCRWMYFIYLQLPKSITVPAWWPGWSASYFGYSKYEHFIFELAILVSAYLIWSAYIQCGF